MPARIKDTQKQPASPAALTLPAGSLKVGANGPAVKQLQDALVRFGFMTKAQANTGPGKFGPMTKASLIAFQQKWGLDADGAYGPKTRKALVDALAGKKPPVHTEGDGHDHPSGPPVAPSRSPGLFHTDAFKGKVALTFDDGPHPVNTPKVLDILKKHKVKATFFVTGQNAKRYPELIKRMVKEGHTIGNHSYDHANLSKMGPAQVRADLRRTQQAVDEALGRHYEIDQFRPPYGATNETVKEAARGEKDFNILWNVDSNDWRYTNNDAAIMKNIFEGTSSVYARGGVILFHDIHPQSVRVLDDVIARLQKEGFDIQKTDRLIGEKYGR